MHNDMNGPIKDTLEQIYFSILLLINDSKTALAPFSRIVFPNELKTTGQFVIIVGIFY